jgi:hypothetical protein
MTDLQRNHEEGFVRAFVEKSKQDRFISLLTSAKHRRKFTVELAHFKGLDERFALPIPPKTAHTVKEICQLLRSKGAGQTVWVISELAGLDGRELGLDEALSQVWGTTDRKRSVVHTGQARLLRRRGKAEALGALGYVKMALSASSV